MMDRDVADIKDDGRSESAPIGATGALERQLGHLESQFSMLNDQVRELQRLASLGTMSAVVAHEINNLLTPMITYGQFAVGQSDPEVWRKAVERANTGAARMRTLCNGILGIASNARSSPKVAAIGPILEETFQALGRDWKKDRIDAVVDVDDELTACFDPAALRQVLFNLSINARQAMIGQGGRLRLSAEAVADDRVQIRISDTGVGIPTENLSRIFEPFFTTKRKADRADLGGVGLGLYVCRCLIEDQRGSIRVESRSGEGTTFVIDLPKYASDS